LFVIVIVKIKIKKMGRGKGNGKGKLWNRKRKQIEKDEKEGKERKRSDNKKDGSYGFNILVQSNELMELYYAYQGLHNIRLVETTNKDASDTTTTNTSLDCKYVTNETDEEKEVERQLFLKTIRQILPSAFRISEDTEETFLKVFLKELHDHLNVSTTEILPSSYFKELPFIPHGYQLAIDKRTIRKHKELSDFHEWLKQQTLSGIMTRQETVSMIPVQLLDIDKDHSVMDMCAAPGSKTCQILEKLSHGKGFVLANDSDAKRAFMLIHQLRRMNSSRVVVTSCEAQKFPLPFRKEGMFDRVLADVPCSGDGTVRKNPGIWKSWSTLGAMALHTLQLNIALRGASLCKVGGYMVYSTCSLNPIENEAVVTELLKITDGALELVDARPRMKGLKARPGMQSWKVIFSNETNREKKNRAKKNNKKMQSKRAMYEKKNKAADDDGNNNDGDDKDGDAKVSKPTASNDDDKKIESTEKKEETLNQFNRSIKTPTDEPYPPFSWTRKEEKSNDADPNSLSNRLISLGQEIFSSYDEVPLKYKLKLRPSHFPPTCQKIQSQLKHCIRVVPQDMDTGGFFVALFRKNDNVNAKVSQYREQSLIDTKLISSQIRGMKDGSNNDKDIDMQGDEDIKKGQEVKEVKPNDSRKNNNITATNENNDDKTPVNCIKENLEKKTNFVVKPEQSILDDLKKYYKLSSDFPYDQLYRRTDGESKVLYYVHKSIQEEIFTNTRNIPIIHTGTKIFSRNNRLQEIPYRITQDGIEHVAPNMKDSDRYIVANNDEFLNCMHAGVNILVDGDNQDDIEKDTDNNENNDDQTEETKETSDFTDKDENDKGSNDKDDTDSASNANDNAKNEDSRKQQQKNNNQYMTAITPSIKFSDEFINKIKKLSFGSFVIVLQNYENDYDKKMFLSMWKCRSPNPKINCLMNKIDVEDMKRKVIILSEVSGVQVSE